MSPKKPVAYKVHEETQRRITELAEALCVSKTAVIEMAVARFYQECGK